MAPGLEVKAQEGNRGLVKLFGSWRLRIIRELEALLANQPFEERSQWILDGSAVEEIDTAGAMLVLRRIGADRGVNVELTNFSPQHKSIVTLAKESLEPPAEIKKIQRFGIVESVGRSTVHFADTVLSIIGFIGQTSLELVRALKRPKLFRVKEFFVQLQTAGVDAIAIVALVTFLIGIVVVYLSGVQIERYGANIFVVDGISLAMCRELSPILVAIIVAGRSGSAFTAQLGTMKLNEEIDAIVALGLSPARVLVLPRILALIIAMPLLTFVGDVTGILGGMLIADLRLGVSTGTFIERLRVVLYVKSIVVGMVKAPVFAFFIATIGCSMGLSVQPNARSVGLATTATVVRSIVAVILLNAAFAVIFSELGI